MPISFSDVEAQLPPEIVEDAGPLPDCELSPSEVPEMHLYPWHVPGCHAPSPSPIHHHPSRDLLTCLMPVVSDGLLCTPLCVFVRLLQGGDKGARYTPMMGGDVAGAETAGSKSMEASVRAEEAQEQLAQEAEEAEKLREIVKPGFKGGLPHFVVALNRTVSWLSCTLLIWDKLPTPSKGVMQATASTKQQAVTWILAK